MHLIYRQLLLLLLSLLGLSACQEKPLFERLDATDTGIHFANTIAENDTLNVLDFEYIYNGGGVAVGDVDNDGKPDVFFTGNQVSSRLYLNKSQTGGADTTDQNRGDEPLRFLDITEAAGVRTKLWCTGVSMVDINADGWLDIYVCTISPKRGQTAPNLFFINQGKDASGQVHFREMAHEMGLDDRGYSTQAAFFDYDRDGDLDCYLLTNALEAYNRNQPRGSVRDGSGKSTDRLYRNEGGRQEGKNGEQEVKTATQMADQPRDPSSHSPSSFLPSFKDVSHEAGITIEGWGLGVAIADINRDGWPDVYCANDFQSNDLLWINNQDGTFTNRYAEYIKHGSYNAMGVDVADLNNDGRLDLMTLDMMPEDNRRQKSMFGTHNPDRFQMGLDRGYAPQYVRNALQLNQGPDSRGHTSFSEVGQLAGVYCTDWSWSTLMADFDNDGHRDIFITNGYPKDITDLDFVAYNSQYKTSYFNTDSETDKETREKMTELIGVKKSNFMFRNTGKNSSEPPVFEDITQAWGLNIPSFSNGAAYADFDGDGDLDIVVNNIDDEAFVYQNKASEKRKSGSEAKEQGHYLRLNLVGEGLNSAALGASVELTFGQQKQAIDNSPYRGYKSTVEPTLHIGLGAARQVDTLTVRWLNGYVTQLTNVRADQVLTLRQADAKTKYTPQSALVGSFGLFTELTGPANPLPFVQEENNFVDFKEQVLLPHRLSQGGPALAVGDVDGNGTDDVFVGGAAHKTSGLFRQLQPGKFTSTTLTGTGVRKFAEDMGALFFDADNDGQLDLYVVSGGNEYPADNIAYQDRLYHNRGRGQLQPDSAALPNTRGSGSCVVAADYDRDGDLDLFVGGRTTPRKYPLPGRSYLLRNDSKPGHPRFTDVTDQVAPGLANCGMVTAALWTDTNNDTHPDLLLVGEWMAPTLFENRNNRLKRVDSALTTQVGWWNSLVGGDFDNDGDIDYVAGNLGKNSRFQASAAEPVSIYAKDYDQNNTLDPVMCLYIQGKCYPTHPRDQLAEQVPGLKKRFPTYADYGNMTFDKVLTDEERAGAYVVNATNLTSSYIENRGNNQFAIRPLPAMAQITTVQGILVGDYNTDGQLDVLLVGNAYDTDTQVGRYDAGKGLLLCGNGKGGFRPQTMLQSGFCADRNARSLVEVATSPGQSLLLVGNNSDTLQTFRRRTAISLKHPSLLPHPDDFIALIPLPGGKFRRQELYYGSGYLSQTSRTAQTVPVGTTYVNFRGQRRQ
ncbi:VCBS repeat-containing protein [Fibrella sp. HMF5335]|uniref:VCBS repeat-containing protein n=1 Tax=Fibrella rubiginis TaxID=2817060 RepID=A0A939GIP6_9BACT|nr:VCBS repeat-containing protein [Fibrella rubiginis]MBO0939799.1 VCBS repeat-containing protein [Fibrella rubiginis]